MAPDEWIRDYEAIRHPEPVKRPGWSGWALLVGYIAGIFMGVGLTLGVIMGFSGMFNG